MRLAKILSALMLAGCVASGTIGGAYYDPAYDYSEFFAVTDGRNFQVVMAGAPFPNLPASEVRSALLPVMQPSPGPTSPSPTPARPSCNVPTTGWCWCSTPPTT